MTATLPFAELSMLPSSRYTWNRKMSSPSGSPGSLEVPSFCKITCAGAVLGGTSAGRSEELASPRLTFGADGEGLKLGRSQSQTPKRIVSPHARRIFNFNVVRSPDDMVGSPSARVDSLTDRRR